MRGLDAPKRSSVGMYAAAAVALVLVVFYGTSVGDYLRILTTSTHQPLKCPVPVKIVPAHSHGDVIETILHDDHFRTKSARKLSGAVQVDTQVRDLMPSVDESPETWAHFAPFHEYLRSTFPTVFEHCHVETVNTYGLLITYQGSSKKEKPLVLMAHQDVVPVQKDTIDQWTYSPFSGHYDGNAVWGRGSLDCKNLLIAILELFELLIAQGYTPERSIVASFGFDEEVSGHQGAQQLGKALEKKYGRDGVYAVIDEGMGLTIDPILKRLVAIPATAEKGYTDVLTTLTVKGGHSSVPPDHTAIGLMLKLASAIEDDQYLALLSAESPFMQHLVCAAVHATDMLATMRKAILSASKNKVANKKVVSYLEKLPIAKYLVKTSQAIDIVKGGEKANSLPEHVLMVVNHRIALELNVESVHQRFTSRVVDLAKEYNLTVVAWNKTVHEGSMGTFELLTLGTDLEPAPKLPVNDTTWDVLAGTTRQVFEDYVFPNATYPIVMVPLIFTANTDTRHYWNLTRNIYRFTAQFILDPMTELHIHLVDERMPMDPHLQLVAWLYEYIQNVDAHKSK